eukprot:7884580-Alexandrium_andersonii.AAC.1
MKFLEHDTQLFKLLVLKFRTPMYSMTRMPRTDRTELQIDQHPAPRRVGIASCSSSEVDLCCASIGH